MKPNRKPNHSLRRVAAAICGICGLAAATLAAAAPGDDIRALLEKRQSREAFELGQKQADNFGVPAFDFYYGIAALDAGVPGAGVLALERYLLSYPDNRSARYQLARGYFILGEDQRARDEFQALLPAAQGDEKSSIERFLDAIKAREYRYQAVGGVAVEFGLGYDSNINSGIPAGTAFNGNTQAINGINTKEASPFTTWSVSGNATLPIEPGLYAFGSANLDVKNFSKRNDDIFDQTNFGLVAGLSWLTGQNLYRASLGVSGLDSDNQHYMDNRSLSVDWQHQMNQFDRFNLGVQLATNRFNDITVFSLKDKSTSPGSSRGFNNDADFTGISGGWTHAFVHETNPTLTLSGNLGQSKNRRSRDDLASDTAGLRIGGSLTPMPQWGVSAGLSYQDSKYQDIYSSGQPKRHDQYTALDASVVYAYDKNISFRVEALVARQTSNIALNAYDRNVLTGKVRYEFK